MEANGFKKVECVYFGKPGPKNTDTVFQVVAERAAESSIQRVVVATCSGDTALKARKVLPDSLQVIAVTHVTGFKEPNVQELDPANAKALWDQGVCVITAGHAFGGVGRAFRNKTGSYQVDEVMAYTLRIFGQGIKVVAEIAMMAADAGAVRTDEDIIAVAGTARGADTAVILQPVTSARFFDMKIKEILCKPFHW